jgi:hypothetical protein
MRPFPALLTPAVAAAVLACGGAAFSLDYRKDILPIVKANCWDCHSNEKEAKGGLALDDLEELAKGQVGPVGLIRPGEPGKSEFLARVKLDEKDEDFMPRRGKALRNSEISKIEQWILEGAVLDAENLTEAERVRAEEAKLAAARAGGEVYFQWSNPEGKSFEAKFAGLEGDSVKLLTRERRGFVVPLASLDEPSAALARKLGGRP